MQARPVRNSLVGGGGRGAGGISNGARLWQAPDYKAPPERRVVTMGVFVKIRPWGMDNA